MEGMGGFPDAEFDLLGMLFPGNDPDGACTSLSQYSMADAEGTYTVHAAGVNATGFDEDYSYCSLVNVDPSLQWSSGFYVPAADLSTIANTERIREEIVKDDSHVQTADNMPPEGHFVAGKGKKRRRKPIETGEYADAAIEISETPKKRPRQPRVKRQGGARTRRHRKSCEAVDNETNDKKNSGDGENPRQERQSPITSCSSEDDVNSQQLSASDDPNNNGAAGVKPRAGGGAATDPQSLYARVTPSKRRERINERLKILQNLIPNGTKVDISTMLEEAVDYVKFLQLQIKLLSSDEMWMYAPIASNGKDIGLNRLFSSQL